MPTLRSIAILVGAALASAAACASSPPAASEPTAAAATADAGGPAPSSAPAPDGSPMYKPSGRSPAPMSIVDPEYGAFSGAPDAPGMGETLPDFEVPLADGGMFSLEQARKAGPVLVMFYRGFW